MSSFKPQSPAQAATREPPRAAGAAVGSQAGASLYTRFIPREELGSFSAWNPNEFGSEGQAPAAERAAAGGGAASAATAAGRVGSKPAAAGPTGVDAAELARQVQAARQAGYQDGYRDGLAALESFKQSFTAQLTQQLGGQAQAVIEQLQQRLDSIEQQLAGRVAGVALELARQVVRSEISLRPERVVSVAEEALAALLTSARQVSVRLHPDDHAMVAHSLKETLHARGAKLVADPAMARGGVVVESDIAIVDAGVPARWRKAAALLGSRDEWGHEPDDDAGGEA